MITVLGSLNMDIVTQVDTWPNRGETKFGTRIDMMTGGKGANQAVTCGKLGKDVAMIGCVGADYNGHLLLASMRDNGVDTQYVKRIKDANTGTAVVMIDATAENTMIVVKGANELVERKDIDACADLISKSRVLLVQMEIPHDVVRYAIELARSFKVLVILDPAPCEGVGMDLLALADVITPNRQETKHFTGIDPIDESSALEAAKKLRMSGVRGSIIKMGEQGSLVYVNGEIARIEGIAVQAVDTVGAGDSFAGALAAALHDGASVVQAAQFATAVSALKVTRSGAQTGIPTAEEVRLFGRARNLMLFELGE